MGRSHGGKKIVCKETGKIYNYLCEAADKLDISKGNIWSCLNGRRKQPEVIIENIRRNSNINTTEIKFNNEITSFDKLFELAKEQFINYEKLEGIEDWDSYDFSIDCSSDQMKFKDMLQIRFIEELTEASESMDEDEEHFWEEIGDALNFFLSAYVMLGVDFNKLKDPKELLYTGRYKKTKINILEDFSVKAYPVIEKVGFLCNLLKNRPWAESNYLVSIYDFEIRLNDLWETFWTFMSKMKLKDKDIFEMFWKKYKVNEHRRATGY